MVSKIARALRPNTNQHRHVLNTAARTHHTLLTGAEYDQRCEFRVSSIAVKSVNPEEYAAADYRVHVLSYTKITLLINQNDWGTRGGKGTGAGK